MFRYLDHAWYIFKCITLGLYKFPRLNVRFSISAFFEVNLISASASLDILVMSEFFSLLHWKCIPYGNLFLITRASHSWWEIDRHAGYIFNVTIKTFRHYYNINKDIIYIALYRSKIQISILIIQFLTLSD